MAKFVTAERTPKNLRAAGRIAASTAQHSTATRQAASMHVQGGKEQRATKTYEGGQPQGRVLLQQHCRYGSWWQVCRPLGDRAAVSTRHIRELMRLTCEVVGQGRLSVGVEAAKVDLQRSA